MHAQTTGQDASKNVVDIPNRSTDMIAELVQDAIPRIDSRCEPELTPESPQSTGDSSVLSQVAVLPPPPSYNINVDVPAFAHFLPAVSDALRRVSQSGVCHPNQFDGRAKTP